MRVQADTPLFFHANAQYIRTGDSSRLTVHCLSYRNVVVAFGRLRVGALLAMEARDSRRVLGGLNSQLPIGEFGMSSDRE